jgi:DNA-binding transcriptional regulator YhcF (GntR family)
MRISIVGAGGTPAEQIRDQVGGLVAAGGLAAGDRLPSVRQLAADLGVAAGTVAKAYKELENAGIIETKIGVGTRVTQNPGLAPRGTVEHARRLVAASKRDGLDVESVIRIIRAVW